VDRDERLKELEDKYEGYEIYDNMGEKIGKVDDLFIDETDREEYIGVKMGLFGLSGKTLIPMEIARVDEQERRIEVAASKDQAKSAPHYHDDDDIDHEFEAKIRDHFVLERQEASSERGTYGRYVGATVGEGGPPSGDTGATSPAGTEDRDFVGRETHRDREELGGLADKTSAGPAEERTIRRDVDEPLEPRDDEPLEQTVTIIRVRRVDIIE
jgi:sporulation protein YlmC with PRC-barrel domain